MTVLQQLLWLMVCAVFALPVEAHVLHRDETIGGVLHISPSDDPIAGDVSSLFIIFKDKERLFTIEACQCEVVIQRQGETLFHQVLSGPADDEASLEAGFSFIFPQKDTYRITVTGEPLVEGQFEPFMLTYTVRVEREADKIQPVSVQSHAWFSTHAAHAFVVFIGSIVAIVMIRRESIRKK